MISIRTAPPAPRRTRDSIRGFAMLSAVFILVVVAALGGYIAVISSQQHIASALDVQGVRAYAAARSGLEWGLYQVNVVNSHGACTAASGNFSPSAPTLLGYTVSVSCTVTTDSNGGPSVFVLTSVACNQPVSGACPNTTAPGVNYVERRIDVTF